MAKNALELILDNIELSATEYNTAKDRYESLGKFLSEKSSIKEFEPEIFSQGSFRLGTAIKSINPDDPYDLDLTCKLTKGIDISKITQKQFKELVGHAIEEYRIQNGVIEPLESKRRCWRMNYRGKPGFYIDIVPGISASQDTATTLTKSMLLNEVSATDSALWGSLAYNITDDKRHDYQSISLDWNISNPEGYAQWFETRMKLRQGSEKMAALNDSCEPIPTFLRKTILQRCIQLLKRHRDIMYINDDLDKSLKPISIIITTLAARAYNGEATINEAITGILNRMNLFIRKQEPRIPNPTIPDEDFADKWKEKPQLETEFIKWLYTAQIDFDRIINNMNPNTIVVEARNKFGTSIDENQLNIKRATVTPIKERTDLDRTQVRPHRC